MLKKRSDIIPQSVNGTTGQHLFCTVALFAWILGKNVLCWWFMGGKSNHLCLWQDTEILTSCLGEKYGIGINRDCRQVRNSSLSLHCYWSLFLVLTTEINSCINSNCYWLRWTIQLLEEVWPEGFRMATSSSVNRLWYICWWWWLTPRSTS